MKREIEDRPLKGKKPRKRLRPEQRPPSPLCAACDGVIIAGKCRCA